MKDGRILARDERVAAVSVATDEYIAREGGYTFDDTAANTHEAALLRYDSTVTTTGLVKVTLAGGTVITCPIEDLVNAEAHVIKVWLASKDVSITEDTIYLWL